MLTLSVPSGYLHVSGRERGLDTRMDSDARHILASNLFSPEKHINKDWVRVRRLPFNVSSSKSAVGSTLEWNAMETGTLDSVQILGVKFLK